MEMEKAEGGAGVGVETKPPMIPSLKNSSDGSLHRGDQPKVKRTSRFINKNSHLNKPQMTALSNTATHLSNTATHLNSIMEIHHKNMVIFLQPGEGSNLQGVEITIKKKIIGQDPGHPSKGGPQPPIQTAMGRETEFSF